MNNLTTLTGVHLELLVMRITKELVFVKTADALPELEGHYDSWTKKDGRITDAYFENGKWFDEYMGNEIGDVEWWASSPSPFDA